MTCLQESQADLREGPAYPSTSSTTPEVGARWTSLSWIGSIAFPVPQDWARSAPATSGWVTTPPSQPATTHQNSPSDPPTQNCPSLL